MMRSILFGLFALAVTAMPAAAQSPADNPFFLFDEILPVYKAASQKAVCMASCDDFGGPGCTSTVTITFYDQNGNTLIEQTFPFIPNNGNRYIVYTGPQKNISCKITSPELIVSRIKRTVAILDAAYHTVSMTSNDADTLFQ